MGRKPPEFVPFRPTERELEAIERDVAKIAEIQEELVERHPSLSVRDRVAHQYQIAGGKVRLEIDAELPGALAGVGLFEPGARHVGVGRISTGLGCPHLETDPDFLGLMAAFETESGRRVDFLAINHPAAPTDNHKDFVSVLVATGKAAGAEVPILGDWGEYDLGNLVASNTRFGLRLLREMGPIDGLRTASHIVGQTLRTARSSSAYQPYWTGVVETGGRAGKFVFTPTADENPKPELRPGERHLTEDWRTKQSERDLVFRLGWLPYSDPETTPTDELSEPWEEDGLVRIGRLIFPRTDPETPEAGLWAALAAEMGANPGNWVRDREDSIPQPATEFGVARQIGYGISQSGRGALPPEAYREVFRTGTIDPDSKLAAELQRRRRAKADAGHVDMAPA